MKPSEVIRQYGWTKGTMHGANGYCALGAWAVANGAEVAPGQKSWGGTPTMQRRRALFETRFMTVARQQFPERFPWWARPITFVTSFNDQPTTTVSDVLMILEKIEADEPRT